MEIRSSEQEIKDALELYDGIWEIYDIVIEGYQALMLATNDLQGTINELDSVMHLPTICTTPLRRNNHLIRNQAFALGKAVKTLERLCPETCNLNYDMDGIAI